MRKAKWIVLLLILLVAAGLLVHAAYRWGQGNPIEVPQLPPETVTVEVVKEIPVPVEIQVEVPGPVRVVDRVQWRTQEVEVPVETVREVVRWLGLGEQDVEGRVRVEGWKFEGLDDQGRLAAGWRGHADCEVRAAGEPSWLTVVSQPFSLAESTAETVHEPTIATSLRAYRASLLLGVTTGPGVQAAYHRRIGRGRFGWYVGGDYVFSPSSESVSSCVDGQYGCSTWNISESAGRLHAGISFSWGR